MRKTIQGECFSCHDKQPMNFMPRAVVNGADVILCRSCNYHLENYGSTPQPIIFPPAPIHCDQCKRLYTKVDIYQINDRKLCLLCESVVKRKTKPPVRKARLSFSWRTGIVIVILLGSLIGVTKGEEFFDPLYTTQQEISDYVQTVTNPLNELNNQLMTDLGVAGVSMDKQKAIDYEEQLERIASYTASKEEELIELVEREKHKIEILKKMIKTSQLPDPKQRTADIESLVSELQNAHEQGNKILTDLFNEKEIKYNQKEGELMHFYYIGGK
ncbi:hypothetical protein [Lysinibacillus odysseyi]|uniref:Uncharacterized protein n=1 Tax=Lysinibacillus odysseyi 34hs-1 = NBRC 100172 TaxID=1220589 RepID=A0A0A3IDT7_9BACI|nr:hypothetical protein [Lysinibacillus odysseyi]KGR82874.1 hypothetical protein CD32_18740 [Lysinibacillus odysseyi 34hs-1 = NBRC 100172]